MTALGPRLVTAALLAVALSATPVAAADTGATQAGHEAAEERDAREREPFRATSHRRFDDVEHWRKVFDAADRDEWQKPAAVVEALDIDEGMTIVDLGAGTGYFAAYLGAAVGERGHVFAVETEPNLVAYLRERAEAEGLSNLTPVLGSFDNPRIARASADLVLIVDTFHHIDERKAYFRRLAGTLKPGGRVAIIDWKAGELPEGPPPAHKLPRSQVLEEMLSIGYTLVSEPDLLPYQYFLVFAPR